MSTAHVKALLYMKTLLKYSPLNYPETITTDALDWNTQGKGWETKAKSVDRETKMH